MMDKDRGVIKWTSMMLPEHLELLREFKNTDYIVPPKELTEWELDELQQTIDHALNQQLDVKLSVWMDGKVIFFTGIIKSINFSTNELILETLLNTKHIPLQFIQSAQLEADYYD